MVRVLKDKTCSRCRITYKPSGTAQRYCETCVKVVRKETSDRYRVNKGIPVGVGSGGNQGRGKGHHTYKTGIGTFRDLARNHKPPFCERCQKALSFLPSDRYLWCVHHKDHNRHNNELDNLELLCKRCHQLEHDCISNLPNTVKV